MTASYAATLCSSIGVAKNCWCLCQCSVSSGPSVAAPLQRCEIDLPDWATFIQRSLKLDEAGSLAAEYPHMSIGRLLANNWSNRALHTSDVNVNDIMNRLARLTASPELPLTFRADFELHDLWLIAGR